VKFNIWNLRLSFSLWLFSGVGRPKEADKLVEEDGRKLRFAKEEENK
jgi:hypothetical protein